MSTQKQKSRLSSSMEIRAGILHEDRKGCSHGKRKLEKNHIFWTKDGNAQENTSPENNSLGKIILMLKI